MNNKFKGVPFDEDTKIVFRQEAKFGQYDTIHEVWIWDSIIAESFIFYNEDIKGLSDDELKRLVKSSEIFKIDSDVLVKRSETGYTFVNYINKLS